MPAIDYSSHINITAPTAAGAQASAQTSGLPDVSFSDLLDIVNPLQHLPVISTLYRAITGDKIGTPEKIAGDTLYGGLYGFVASLADSAFQAITGKSVGDTVLAFLTGSDSTASSSGVAAAAPASAVPASVTPATAVTLPTPDISALMQSLSSKGVDPSIATRAVYAYGKAVSLSSIEPAL